jgi:radical SAM superfamily enzyme YgiQ (UPF0313 family)
MAKVLLVQTRYERKIEDQIEKPGIPANLLWLASAIEHKHPVKIYDRNIKITDKEFIEFVKSYNPNIIGFTTMTSPLLYDLIHLGNLIKKEFPQIMIVAGGVHATIEPDSLLSEPYIDYILRGECEEAFLEFCNVFDKNPKKLGKIKNVNHNPLRPFLKMEDIKLPNYNLINPRDYGQFFISTSRGCPGKCSFCFNIDMWGDHGNSCVRIYSLEKVKQLLIEVIEKQKVREFTIADENFVTFKKRCIEICRFLKEKYNGKINFNIFARADFFDDKVAAALKEAGCHSVQFGTESGNQRVLNFLNKNITVEKQAEAYKICRRHGLFSNPSFMIGIPTETTEEMNDTIRFIKIYKPDVVGLGIFNPLPGSAIFNELVKAKKIKKPKTLLEWADWSTSNFLVLKHNLSEIPDDILWEAANEMWRYRYPVRILKKMIYWISRGQIKPILDRVNMVVRRLIK